jgi:hypothetical protein
VWAGIELVQEFQRGRDLADTTWLGFSDLEDFFGAGPGWRGGGYRQYGVKSLRGYCSCGLSCTS